RPLLRVLLNVIKNGIEASPSGERVTVRARVKNEDLVISVEDNGPGIPNKIRSKIFEPFFTTKGEFADKGIGLGLSISRSLIQAMEGSISFSTNAKKGTVCTLALPLRQSEMAYSSC
ncbi:MAG: ATP-binding protein, partial [bacterium]